MSTTTKQHASPAKTSTFSTATDANTRAPPPPAKNQKGGNAFTALYAGSAQKQEADKASRHFFNAHHVHLVAALPEHLKTALLGKDGKNNAGNLVFPAQRMRAKVFNNECDIPRDQLVQGEPKLNYKYSGVEAESEGWTPRTLCEYAL
jgi:hypothetical protein